MQFHCLSTKLQKKVNLYLKNKNIDLVFLSSDRFETFAFAISTYLKKIPIIHHQPPADSPADRNRLTVLNKIKTLFNDMF